MPPSVALFFCLILLFWLFRYDPAKESKTSLALWVPLTWMFIVASRLPSQWLGSSSVELAAQAFEEGNALDRTILSVLIVLAIAILTARSFKWGNFFAHNFILTVFLLFALTSVLWSDFPFISLKRWFRDLGNYLVVLVVVSDAQPQEALCTLLRRLCYLLIPPSILLIKYYPQIGKQYEFWSGTPMFVGVATSKNMLGVACLVSGIFFFWDTVRRWPDRKDRRTKRVIILDALFFAMTIYLLNVANSATCRVCLLLGSLVIAAAHTKRFKRNPAFLRILIPASLCLYMVLQYGFGINGQLAGMVGRNATLTGRTDLWKLLLSMHTNPLLGTGYQSFWLGPRLALVWQTFAGGINEAHNGYLEIYLNLGLLGLLLLGLLLISMYRSLCRKLKSISSFAVLSLALWTVLMFYNVTEAAFAGGLIWITLMAGALSLQRRHEDRVRDIEAFKDAKLNDDPLPDLALEPMTLLR